MLAFTQDTDAVSENVYFPHVQEVEVLGVFFSIRTFLCSVQKSY